MRFLIYRFLLLVAAAGILLLRPAYAIVPGQVDDFEDGTTQNWIVNLLGQGTHPGPPQNIATGGPAGVDDNYLLLTSVGGSEAGSKLSVINLVQWGGDYLAAGVIGIQVQFNNLGSTELHLRLLLSDPTTGPPANAAFSTIPFVVPAGSGWVSAFFPVTPADLTEAVGDAATALANATELRIFHAEAPAFPGEAIASSLGVDNITALGAAAAPEPSALCLAGVGLVALAGRRMRKGP